MTAGTGGYTVGAVGDGGLWCTVEGALDGGVMVTSGYCVPDSTGCRGCVERETPRKSQCYRALPIEVAKTPTRPIDATDRP